MSKQDHVSRWWNLATACAKVADVGGAVSRYQFEANWEPYCDKPIPIFVATDKKKHPGRPLELSLTVPCRKCDKCLWLRKTKWQALAVRETYLNREGKNWLFTLTFSRNQMGHAIGRVGAMIGSPDFNRLLERELYKDVKAHFDVVRSRYRRALKKRYRASNPIEYKKHGYPKPLDTLRYFAVHERGDETQRSHFHCLVHGDDLLTYRILTQGWGSRVKDCSLLEDPVKASVYVSKYLGKNPGRIRSSKFYGLNEPRRETSLATRRRLDATASETAQGRGQSVKATAEKEPRFGC